MYVTVESMGIRFSTTVLVTAIVLSLFAGGLLGYYVSYPTISERIDNIQTQLSNIPSQNVTYLSGSNITYLLDENVSLSQLYKQVEDSVVIIRGLLVQYDFFGRPYYSQVQGSGFVYDSPSRVVIVTNYHVVQNAINITVTLADGDAYLATTLGFDPYADLAVLSSSAPQAQLQSLQIVNSSTLQVGDPVIAIGTPYGLAGSMTVGIISALGRTMTEDMTGGYPIASVIQTSTAINPGNSGGPLLNYRGQVVGITTAIVTDSQGLGFAIPSNSILREIESLVANGSYEQHPSLGATGTDMTYEIAQAMGTNVTYGWLVATAPSDTGLHGGTSQSAIAGSLVTIGGDIIISINGTRITSLDDLSTYLEENTQPNETINVGIVRNNASMDLLVKLGKRPQPSTT
jgi:S1-C subfamily serine protease